MSVTPHDLAVVHGKLALEEATRLGLSRDAVARGLLDFALATFLAEGRKVADVAAELRYEAEQLEGDDYHPFMRP
jgi:hypothetical protein